MKLWKRTNSDQQVGGRPSANPVWPRVSKNPNGAEDVRSFRLGLKTHNNTYKNNNCNNNNNNNNKSNGSIQCQDKCWMEPSRRSLQHLPGLFRAVPETWRTDKASRETSKNRREQNRASPESSSSPRGFASLPYYFPNNLTNQGTNTNPNLYYQRSNSDNSFSSLPPTTGFSKKYNLYHISLLKVSLSCVSRNIYTTCVSLSYLECRLCFPVTNMNAPSEEFSNPLHFV